MKRLPASAETPERLSTLFSGTSDVDELKVAMVGEAARLIVEEVMEGEAADALGLGYYKPGAEPGRGYRHRC